MKGLFTYILMLASLAAAAQQMTNKGLLTTGENGRITVSEVTNDGEIASAGDWKIAGSMTNNGTMEMTGNTEIAKTSPVVIGGSSAITFSDLDINAPGGVKLNTGLVVTNTLNLVDGMVNINGQTISLASTGRLTGEEETRRIYGVSGLISLDNQSFEVDSSYNDVGGLGIDIRFNGTTGQPGSVDFKRHYSSYGLAERIVQISPETNIGLDADVVLHYFDDELTGEEGDLKLNESLEGINVWNEITGSLDTTANTLTMAGRSSLFYYGFTDGMTPLPVELLSFKGYLERQQVHLEWQTASELNNDRFIIQRSADGKTFREIAEVKGNGTTKNTSYYNFMDAAPQPGTNYYRLLQVDFSGRSAYSPLITVHIGRSGNERLAIYPNPVSQSAKRFYLQLPAEGAAEVNIYNSRGQLLVTQNSNGRSLLEIDLARFSAGAGEMLFITVTSAEWQTSAKLLIK